MTTIDDVDITSREFKADPYPFYARLRAEAPVARVRLPDRRSVWLIARYDDVEQALKEPRLAKNRREAMTAEQLRRHPWVPKRFEPLERNMLDLDDVDHARLRGLVQKAFTARRVERLRDQVQDLADELLDAALDRPGFDLIRDYALPLPVTVIARLLGVPVADGRRFHRYTAALLGATGSRWVMVTALPSVMLLLRYLRRLIDAKRAEAGDDLLSALIDVEEEGDRLDADELLAMTMLLLIAGHETTVNLIGNGALALIEHPGEQQRLRDDPGLDRPAIEELLRYHSPVMSGTERYPLQDLTIAGTTIPRGELVFALIDSANRDERQFADPDRLDLSRHPNRHLAFGHGVHHCLGAPLARLEGQVAIRTLLRRVPELRVAGGGLRWRPGLLLRGLESLPLQVPSRITARSS